VRNDNNLESDADDSEEIHEKLKASRGNRWKEDKICTSKDNKKFKRNPVANFRKDY
jgi:hypothetical protein